MSHTKKQSGNAVKRGSGQKTHNRAIDADIGKVTADTRLQPHRQIVSVPSCHDGGDEPGELLAQTWQDPLDRAFNSLIDFQAQGITGPQRTRKLNDRGINDRGAPALFAATVFLNHAPQTVPQF